MQNKSILNIIKEIREESSTNKKMEILGKYKDNELLKKVIYLADSPRIKFYIKQIPEYDIDILNGLKLMLETSLDELNVLSSRQLTGHDGIRHLQKLLVCSNPEDAEVISLIIGKDLKIGMGKNINKVIKGLIEETPYQGAVPFSEKNLEEMLKNPYILSQIKADGRYANAIISNGIVYLESRQGETTHLPDCKLIHELSQIQNDVVLNGELCLANCADRYLANGIIASIISIQKKINDGLSVAKEVKEFESKHGSFDKAVNSIVYKVWDMISIEEYDNKSSEIPYGNRLELLSNLIKIYKFDSLHLIESRVVYSRSDIENAFKEALESGEEGTIVKDGNGPWRDGKHKHQMKFKIILDLDLEISNFNYGTKGTKNENVISSIEVKSSDGLLVTNPAGIKEDMMIYITENQDSLLGKIVQVECSGISSNSKGQYSLLHPRFIKIRDDKFIADSLEQCIANENMTKNAK